MRIRVVKLYWDGVGLNRGVERSGHGLAPMVLGVWEYHGVGREVGNEQKQAETGTGTVCA